MNSTSARSVHWAHSTIREPSSISPKFTQPSRGAAGRALSSTVPANHSTAISK
ncbi:MAG: hypothetical protein R2909_03510 [Gemmatimonadales bacterium]